MVIQFSLFHTFGDGFSGKHSLVFLHSVFYHVGVLKESNTRLSNLQILVHVSMKELLYIDKQKRISSHLPANQRWEASYGCRKREPSSLRDRMLYFIRESAHPTGISLSGNKCLDFKRHDQFLNSNKGIAETSNEWKTARRENGYFTILPVPLFRFPLSKNLIRAR